MRCEEFREHISEYLDGELRPGDRSLYARHQEECPDCLAELRSFARSSRVLADHLPSIEPGAALWSSILREVETPPRVSLLDFLRARKVVFASAAMLLAATALGTLLVWQRSRPVFDEAAFHRELAVYLRQRQTIVRQGNPFNQMKVQPAADPDMEDNPFSRFLPRASKNPFKEME